MNIYRAGYFVRAGWWPQLCLLLTVRSRAMSYSYHEGVQLLTQLPAHLMKCSRQS